MTWFPRGMWRYAVLIVLLLVLAAMAARDTIESIVDLVTSARAGVIDASDDVLLRIVTIPILSLTMGFLFLAGALGVWTIRSIAEIEGRRRIGRFVDAMDYLSDGLVALDRRGRITGLNPAARELAARPVGPGSTLRDLYPCITPDDESRLLRSSVPYEAERVRREPDRLRAFRFRSQPSEDIGLVMVSDVTGQKADDMRGRQAARLQLIGRIARGVAHDFTNILAAVSGYAALMERERGVGEDVRPLLQSIQRESRRGGTLAGQLLELSRTGVKGQPCENLRAHIEKAAELLRVGLSAEWQVATDIGVESPPVPLTDIQVEQVVLNLGLLAADELGTPGIVGVRVRPHRQEALPGEAGEYAVVVSVSARSRDEAAADDAGTLEAHATASEAGVIQSVVRSMVEEAAGRLDVLTGPGGRHSYRVFLPPMVAVEKRMSALGNIPEELRAQVPAWRVLVAGAPREERTGVEQFLRDLGVAVEVAGDIVSALQHVEAVRDLSAMVFDRALLGEEADALLKAILKLRPRAGLVVLCESPATVADHLKADIVFEPLDTSPEGILQALARSREQAVGRGKGAEIRLNKPAG